MSNKNPKASEPTYENQRLAEQVKEEILETLNKINEGKPLKKFLEADFIVELNKKVRVSHRIERSGKFLKYRRDLGPGIASLHYWMFEQLVIREYQQNGGLSRRGQALGCPKGEKPLKMIPLNVDGFQGYEEEEIEPALAVGLPSG